MSDQAPKTQLTPDSIRFCPLCGHGLERRLVLLEIERHLLVADLTHQRAQQEPAGEGCRGQHDDDPESENGTGAEAKGLEGVRRPDQRDGGRRDECDGPLHRELHSPAASDLADDLKQGRSWIAALVVQHRDPLRVGPRHAMREHGFAR